MVDITRKVTNGQMDVNIAAPVSMGRLDIINASQG